MFLLTWDHFKTDNKKLLQCLDVKFAAQMNLHYANGFFIAPDDNINRKSPLPKVLLPKSIVELFKEQYPKIFNDVEDFFKITGGFDRLDFDKFKTGAKIELFYGASYYIHVNKLRELKNINDIYINPYRQSIEDNLMYYMTKFIELAKERKVAINIWALFQFAIQLIKETCANISFPNNFNSIPSFLKDSQYFPNRQIFGRVFERDFQKLFENVEIHEEHYLELLIRSKINENGVLIPLDKDKQFKNAANNVKCISVPDFVFVTSKHIYPIDLKISLEHVNVQQIDGNNLRSLFNRLEDQISAIFQGLTIEGKYISPRRKV